MTELVKIDTWWMSGIGTPRNVETARLPDAGVSMVCRFAASCSNTYVACMTFAGVGRPHGEQPGCATRLWPPDPDRHLQLCG